jgi:hypothetical protein
VRSNRGDRRPLCRYRILGRESEWPHPVGSPSSAWLPYLYTSVDTNLLEKVHIASASDPANQRLDHQVSSVNICLSHEEVKRVSWPCQPDPPLAMSAWRWRRPAT